MQQRVNATGEDTVTEKLVLSLRELGRGDLAIAGGKGANLGELVRAGFPVPPGFVITTAAYDRFVAAGGLGDAVAAVDGTKSGSTCRRPGGVRTHANPTRGREQHPGGIRGTWRKPGGGAFERDGRRPA